MANNKGQGLPLSFIVIAAISALVLILIVAFTIGGLGGFFKQITIAGGGSDLSTVQAACQNACNQAQLVTSLAQFKTSTYCTKTYAIDLNNDGKINATKGNVIAETSLHCWYGPTGPATPCTVQIGDRTVEIAANMNSSACSALS